MKATAEVSQSSSDNIVFEAGTYETRLVEMFMVSGTKYQSDEPQLEAVLMWEIEEGVRPTRDGYNPVKYLANTAKFELKTDRQYVGKFQTRLEALVGQQLVAEDAASFDADIDAPEFVTNFDELLSYLLETDDNGKPRRAKVSSFKVRGQELLGGEALIGVSITEKVKNGQKTEYQKIESITAKPRAKAGPRRTGGADVAPPAVAAQPAAPTEAEQAPLMDPPPARRRATTEPDLPF